MDSLNTDISTYETLHDSDDEVDLRMWVVNMKDRMCPYNTMIIGHRGGFMGPENSMKTFINAKR